MKIKKIKKKVFTQSGVTMHGVLCGGMYQNNASSGSERRGEPLGNLQKSSTYQTIRLVSLFYISVTKEKKKKRILRKNKLYRISSLNSFENFAHIPVCNFISGIGSWNACNFNEFC